MSRTNQAVNQKGFSAVEALLLVLVIALLVFVGWRYWYSQQVDQQPEPAAIEQQDQNEPPEINSQEDLQQSEDFLLEQDIDGELDTSEIDSALEE
jgi:predicted negative regulator of RcsB-dependent stress response